MATYPGGTARTVDPSGEVPASGNNGGPIPGEVLMRWQWDCRCAGCVAAPLNGRGIVGVSPTSKIAVIRAASPTASERDGRFFPEATVSLLPCLSWRARFRSDYASDFLMIEPVHFPRVRYEWCHAVLSQMDSLLREMTPRVSCRSVLSCTRQTVASKSLPILTTPTPGAPLWPVYFSSFGND